MDLFGNNQGLVGSGIGSSVSSHSHSILDPGHNHGIMGASSQLQAYQNHMMNQMANQIGNAAFLGGAQPAPTPVKKPQAWGVSIIKVENGFMVTVTDNITSKSLQYIAADMTEVTEMIATGLVTGRVES